MGPETARSRAVVLVVDDDAAALATTEGELRKRYGADYDVQAHGSVDQAVHTLSSLAVEGRPLALVLADLWMPAMTGVELLARVHDRYPVARRALLVDRSDVVASKGEIASASALGQIDCLIRKPSESPDEQFHQVITELLAEWAKRQGAGRAVVRVVGPRWSPRGHEVRDLLARYGIPYTFHSSETPDGQSVLGELGADAASCPVLALDDGRVLLNPTNAEAADALGGNVDEVDGPFDVVIVGAGPAGLAAAVYAASEGLRTVVVEREAIGGQAGTTSRIRNYLGFPRGISGSDLAVRAYEQAWSFGASFRLLRETLQLRPGFPYHTLVLSDAEEIRARAVVVATGVTYRRLGVPSLDDLVGRGVFYGPAVTEAPALASQAAFVVGGGNSAGQAAVHLAGYASQVTMLVRADSLSVSMSDYLVREIETTSNIEVRHGVEAVAGLGEHRLEGLVLRDRRLGSEESVDAAGLFVLIGGEPHAEWLPPQILRCPRGYVLTGLDASTQRPHHEPTLSCHEWQPGILPLETSVPGVFAAGDVRHRSVKRVASAAGEGAAVVAQVHEHLARTEHIRAGMANTSTS
jgi:thioredoxin reductase (NADPH)